MADRRLLMVSLMQVRKHSLHYDDGDREQVDMQTEMWRLEKKPEQQAPKCSDVHRSEGNPETNSSSLGSRRGPQHSTVCGGHGNGQHEQQCSRDDH